MNARTCRFVVVGLVGLVGVLVGGVGPVWGQERDAAAVFERLDRDKDGKLTKEEFPERVRQNFERFDADKDGVVSAAEFGKTFGQRGRGEAAQRGQDGQQRGPRVPEGVEHHADIAYAGTDNARQTLDLLLPKQRKTDAPLPVVVFIHGGGWRGGHKNTGIGRVSPLVASGRYAGVSVGYRLSGEATWPAQIHDCKAAIRWVRANAAKHGLDASKIAVWGTSAGGHLVAMLGTSGDVKHLEGELGPHVGVSSRVTCVVDWYGPSDMLTMGKTPRWDHNAADAPPGLLLGAAVPDVPDKARDASPVTFVSADDPPFLILHGTADPTVPFAQSAELDKRLDAAGVSSVLITITGGGHGFRGEPIDEAVRQFLGKHLHGEAAELKDVTIDDPTKKGR